jgi:hypothetical protein
MVWTNPRFLALNAAVQGIEEIGVQVEEPLGILALEVGSTKLSFAGLGT